MEKYTLPAIAWLKITDYMHGWVSYELGSDQMIRNQRVICIQHLEGARAVLRMRTVEDMMERRPVGNAMSGTRHNCMEAGLSIDADTMEREYGLTREKLDLFVPIECPKMCMTKNGVLRPWTLDVCFGHEQTTALLKLIRHEFWEAVKEYDKRFALMQEGHKYIAKEMLEAFCAETHTPDMYVDAMRREWQRRLKSEKT